MTQTLAAAMGQGSVARLLFRFSVPAILGLVANALYNIVDRLFIGRFAGADSLGAVGLTFPISVFVIAVGSLVGVGSASQLSRRLGEGRRKEAGKILGTAMTVMTLTAALLTAGGLLCLDTLVSMMGASARLAPLTRIYTEIVFWGLPFNLLGFALNYLIRAEGYPRYAMWTLVIGAGANVFLDWLFIVHMHMGVAGAALGTSLAQIAAFIWVALFYLRGRSSLQVSAASLRPDWDILKETLLVGASPFLMELFYTFSMMLFNNLVNRLGGDSAIAAMGIFFCLDSLIYLPVFGIGEGLQPIVGYSYGAGQYGRLKKAVLLAVAASTAYFMLSFLGAEIFTRSMVLLFNSDDAALIDLTVRAMRIGYIGMPLAAAGIVASNALVAIGKAGMSLFLNLCRQGLLFVPALLLLPRIFGLDGVWGSFAVVDAGGGLVGALLLWLQWDCFGGESGNEAEGRLGMALK